MDILIDIRHREEDLACIPIEAIAHHVIESEGKPSSTEVSITFVDDEEMAALNEEFRGIVGPTDVLSFECDALDDEMASPSGATEKVYELGDVIIAPDVAAAQCEGYGNSFEAEVALLLVHGLLHLCGYDHMEDAEAEAMEARERELLAAFPAYSAARG